MCPVSAHETDVSSVWTYEPGNEGDPGPLAEVRVIGAVDGFSEAAVRVKRGIGNTPATEITAEQTPRVWVIQSIDQNDRAGRRRALRGLVRQPDATAVNELASLLSDDDDLTIRSMAAIGLGKVRIDEAKAALIAALSDEDSLVRRRAVQGLGRMWGKEAVEPLSEALLEDSDPTIRREAALRLGRIGSEEALASLVMAQSDTDRTVRRAADHAMTQMGDP